jgi:hypothetical protein
MGLFMGVLRSLLTVSLVATTLTAGSMSVASAATIEVCATGGGQYSTIQAAVTAASASDTINVCAGTYSENVSIDKALTILGPNNLIAPGTDAIRVSEAVVSGAVTIGSAINGVTLSGFKITSPTPANSVGVTIGSKSRNVSITYNDVSGFNQGIHSQGNSLNFGSGMNVSYNYVHDLSSNASYGSYGIHLRNVKNLTVSNNVINDTVAGITGLQYRRGVHLRGVQATVVENNTVSFGSTASAQATYAIAISQKLNDGGNGNDLAASNVVISGNKLSGVIWGIYISELDSRAKGILVKENTVRKVFTGVHFRSYGQTGGAVAAELTVQQNNFSEIQNSGALISAGILSAGVQVFSIDSSAPALNEFNGILVQQNFLPSRTVNALGQINGINVGAIANPATFSFWSTVINNLNAPGNYWNSARGPSVAGSETSGGGASIKLSPFIASYTPDASKANAPGFWPTGIVSSNNATLSDLVLSTGTLSPAFTSGKTTYTATVANTVATGYSVTPAKSDSNASVVQYLGATGTTPFNGNLGSGQNIIRTVVTAQDGTRTMTYTVTVTRINPRSQTIIFDPGTVRTLTATTTSYTLPGATAGSGLDVTFTTTTPEFCTVDGNILTPLMGGGVCVVRATQTGDGTYSPATQDTKITITRVAQSITAFLPTAMSMASVPQELSATKGAGTAPVTFAVAPASTEICQISNGDSLTVLAAGSCVITASQAQDDKYLATSTTRSIMISKAQQAIDFNPPTTLSAAATPGALSATAGTLLTVTFTSMTPLICDVNVTSLTLIKAGRCTIKASQNGDGRYLSARDVTKSITITKATQEALTVANNNESSIAKGPTGITLTPAGGSGSGAVTYSVRGVGCVLATDKLTVSTSTGLGRSVTCLVTAMKATDDIYNKAVSVAKSFIFSP